MDMLLKGVVRTALRRDSPNVAAVGVVGEGLLVPSFDGIWRIGEDDVELLQLVVLEEGRVGQVSPRTIWNSSMPCMNMFIRAIAEVIMLISCP